MSRKTSSVGSAALLAAAVSVLVGCATTQTVKPMAAEALQAKRDTAQQYYSIGSDYYQRGNYQEALENFRRSLTYDSTYYDVSVAIGLVYRKMLDPVSAEDYFRKAIKLDPKKAKAYEGLGDLFLAMQRDTQALAVYQEGLKNDSSLVDLYNGEAEIYVRWKQMDMADKVYQTAMKRFPDEVSVQRLWADFLYKQGRYSDAVNSLLPLVQRFPKVWELREKLADCFIELKQYDKASAQLDTILQADPGRDQTVLRLGSVYLAWGKPKLAIDRFKSLIAKDSTKVPPRIYYAEALMQQGNYGSAENMLQTVLQMDAGNVQAHVDLGDIRQKQADEQRGPNPPMTSVAKLKRAKALYEEAKAHYARALSDPGLRGYANSKTEYVDKQLVVVNKELFVRE